MDLPFTFAGADNVSSLLPEHPRGVGRPMDDREAWNYAGQWSSVLKLAAAAEQYLQEPVPELGPEQWTAFSKTGDRQVHEVPLRRRTTRLNAFVLAEGLENRRRFLPAIERELSAILEEPSWALASGNPDETPETIRTRIDLVTSARVWTLATAAYWLGPRLDKGLRRRLLAEMWEKVFNPYLAKDAPERIHWWRDNRNNWMAVCHAGVVGAALTIVESREDRARFVEAAVANLPRYLYGYTFTEEGICKEGTAYWDYGFGNYLMLAEMLWQNSEGRINLYESERVRRIATAIRGLELSHGAYPTFSDSPCFYRPNTALLWLINQRVGGARNAWPATPDEAYPHDRPAWAFQDEAGRPDPREISGSMYALHPLGDRLAAYGIFAFPLEPRTGKKQRLPEPRPSGADVRCWFPEPQIGVFRASEFGSPTLAMAVKGGYNDEPHGHHDKGSYVVSLDGWTLLLDPGAELYTKSTFSDERWDSMMNNSLGHPVPLVAGRGQKHGKEAYAEVVSTTFSDEREILVMDLSRCYAVPELIQLRRTFVFDRKGRAIEIVDSVRFDSPQAFGTALITNSPWKPAGAETLLIEDGGYALEVKTTSLSGALIFAAEPVLAPKHRAGVSPTRLGYNLEEPVLEAVIHSVIKPAVQR